MGPRRLQGAIFKMLPDGCVEVPTWAAELMFVFMAYMPYSWKDMVVQLQTIPPFADNLDEYNLVYSFCLAMDAHHPDPVLLSLVSHNPTTGRFRLPRPIEALYNNQRSPLSFWEHPEGLELRRLASDLMATLRQEFRSFSEYTVYRRTMDAFRRCVDEHSSVTNSVSIFRTSWRVLNINHALESKLDYIAW